MSGSNRGFFTESDLIAVAILVAVAIALFTWPTVPRLTDYGEANPKNADYAAGGSECKPEALAAIRDNRERLRRTDTCAREAEDYRQNTADLIQQTRAADAAQAQADIASQQLWTGWLQTLGGFLTLAAAVGAAIYARDAAHQTRLANTFTERMQRPWVTLEVVEVAPFEWDENGLRGELTVQAQNIGGLPAIGTKIQQVHKGGASQSDLVLKEFEIWAESFDPKGWGVSLLSGQPMSQIIPVRIGKDEFKIVDLQGQKGIFPIIGIAVTYGSPFHSEVFQTATTFILGGDGQKKGHLIPIIIDEILPPPGVLPHPGGSRLI